jgi:flagellar assembly factor FliW
MTVEVATSRFGTIQVPPERIFFFPRGLIGFEHLKRFARLDSTKGPAVQWLQAVEDPDTAFLISEPTTYLPSFRLNIQASETSKPLSQGVDPQKLETLTILHVDREQGFLHIHVQAPLLIDPISRKGIQVVTDAENATVAIPLKTSKTT